MSNDNKDTKLYQHKTAQECTAFCVRIKAKARRHSNDDVGAIAVGTTLTGENADARIRYTKGAPLDLHGMVDSDWAIEKSTSGYAYFLAQAVLAWMSKKQASIALSSTEAEIMAASLAALEAIFLRGLLGDVGHPQVSPTPLSIDNTGAVALSRDYISNGKTKHIERRHLKIRELVEAAVIHSKYVPTEDNIADILTKPLGRRRFEKLRAKLLNNA